MLYLILLLECFQFHTEAQVYEVLTFLTKPEQRYSYFLKVYSKYSFFLYRGGKISVRSPTQDIPSKPSKVSKTKFSLLKTKWLMFYYSRYVSLLSLFCFYLFCLYTLESCFKACGKLCSSTVQCFDTMLFYDQETKTKRTSMPGQLSS